MAPKKKQYKKVEKKEAPFQPVEVLVTDCVRREKVVAEYRGENKWWYGTKLYKVYHPLFTEPLAELLASKAITEAEVLAEDKDNHCYRWVMKLGKILGPVASEEEA